MKKITMLTLLVAAAANSSSYWRDPAAPPPPIQTEEARLDPSDGAGNDLFGYSLSVSGETVVVGAPQNGSSGSAYIFTRSGAGWSEEDKLLASDGSSGDFFGGAVAIDGDTVVVGARFDDGNGSAYMEAPWDNTGSAYVFVRSGSTWVEQAKLRPDDPMTNDRFGTSVAVFGDTAVVGAPDDDDNGLASGSVYVFIRSGDTWSQQDKFAPASTDEGDAFGGVVAISGDFIAAGVYTKLAGAVYVFERNAGVWDAGTYLSASDGEWGDFLGWSVSISGNTVVASAPRAVAPWPESSEPRDSGDPGEGAAYVFVRDGGVWSEQAKLTSTLAGETGRFGMSVAVSGDTVVVGSRFDDGAGPACVFAREYGVWTELSQLLASDGVAYDGFGMEASISGSTAVIGTNAQAQSGSAYVYLVPGPLLFADGFESGDTSAWSSTTP